MVENIIPFPVRDSSSPSQVEQSENAGAGEVIYIEQDIETIRRLKANLAEKLGITDWAEFRKRRRTIASMGYEASKTMVDKRDN